MEAITRNPYRDELLEKHGTSNYYIVRTIPLDVSENEFLYEMDSKPHRFTVLTGHDWKYQQKDKAPVSLETGHEYPLPAKKAYRWVKGKDVLVIRIENI